MLESSYIVLNKETFHDTCAAYIKNGNLKCILETERVNRHKHAEYMQPEDSLIPYLKDKFNIDNDITIYDKNDICKYRTHHELHAISSFLSSGYDKACILVIDGAGDLQDSVTLYYGEGKDIIEIKKFHMTVSLGIMYDAIANLLYKTHFSEGKLMGLSCCSDPDMNIPSPIQYDMEGNAKYIYELENEDIITGIQNYVLDKFSYLFNKKDILNNDVYKAKIAATVQYWFTEQVINLVKYLKILYPKVDNLCLAGGCFLNCETNGIIDRLNIFKNIYCIPAPADNGLILGKVQQLLPNPIKVNSPYFGPNYSKTFDELLEIFLIREENKSEIDNIYNITKYNKDWVIERLKQNRVIVWFDNSSEFGPRALGHRSFLANPATNEMFWRLSVDIKQRESYRPLAPITTDTLYPFIFNDPNPENLTQFMLKTVGIKSEWVKKIPAVVHINKTARPQRLKQNINPELYDLIEGFYKETGIPCLINTSLNLKNQPLVENFDDLIRLITDSRLYNKKVSVVVNHKLCFDIK